MSDLEIKIAGVASFWDFQMPGMAMEELAECIQAINKVERAEHEYIMAEEKDPEVADAAWYTYNKRKDELKDEIRDVYISLRALIHHYDLEEDDIMNRVVKKLNKKFKED